MGVSRRETMLSMEALDSALFRIPELVDYRASFDGKLHLHCFCQGRIADAISDTIQRKYPRLETVISEETITWKHRPQYLGKRQILFP